MHARNSSEFLLALDSIQALSQVFFFYWEVRSKKETDQMRPEEQVSRGGGGSFGCLGCLRLKCKASLQLGGGGFHYKRVDVCHLGLSGACSPGTFLILSPLKWLQMHFKLTWCGKTYILSTTKKVAIRNIFSTNSCVAWIGVLISSKQHKELGPACQSWRE